MLLFKQYFNGSKKFPYSQASAMRFGLDYCSKCGYLNKMSVYKNLYTRMHTHACKHLCSEYTLMCANLSRHIKRRMATKSINLRLRINQYQILHRGPDAQPGRRQRAQEVDDVPSIQIPIPGHEPSHQPLHASVLQAHLPGGRVETLAAAQGVFLDVEGNVQEGGEGVGELDDADGGDDGDEAGEGGDGGADDEGNGPVDGDDGHPEEFAGFLGEGWGAEEFDCNVVIEDCGEER